MLAMNRQEAFEALLQATDAMPGRGGINWSWAFFLTQTNAEFFERRIRELGYETRGVYPPMPDFPGRTVEASRWGVRYR